MDHLLAHIYLYLDLFTLLGPLALSFDRKVAFWRTWRWLFPGILVGGAVFLYWDVMFTQMGIWWFNDAYLLGPRLLGLPLEEWLFFLVVPYATVFIYECYRCYDLPRLPDKVLPLMMWGLWLFCMVMGLVYLDRWYTATTFLLLAAMLVVHYHLLGTRYIGNAFIGWGIAQVPFFLVNGVLTALPVVSYNDAENLGIRLYTVPFEDTFYGFLLYLIVLTVLEYRRGRAQ